MTTDTELECITGPHAGSVVADVKVEVSGNGIAEEVSIIDFVLTFRAHKVLHNKIVEVCAFTVITNCLGPVTHELKSRHVTNWNMSPLVAGVTTSYVLHNQL